MLTEDLSKLKMEEITPSDSSKVTRVGLFDPSSQKFKPPEGFTGLFDPSNGDKIPLFREKDGLWYIYYVAAANSTEARKLIKQGKVEKIMWDIGATASIVGLEHEDMISDKRPSRMICRGAFDTIGNKTKSHGVL